MYSAMRFDFFRRFSFVLLFLLVVCALAGAVGRYGYVKGLDSLHARGAADLALASDRLVGQLQRYRDLAVLLADHPDVRATLTPKARTARSEPGLTALLRGVADRSAARDVVVVDKSGRVLDAIHAQSGQDMAATPFVQRALRGALGWGHGAADPLTSRAFFHAAPVFDDSNAVLGAVIVTTDLTGIDYNWRGSTAATFFTDRAGIVFVSNRSELLFWERPMGEAGLLPPSGQPLAFSSRYIGAHEIWELGWGPYLPQRALHLTQDLPVIGLKGEVLLDIAQTRQFALTQAAAVAALCLAFGSLLFVASERRRTLAQANRQLESRVADRTRALRQAQAELVQAGKLSALGQMSAGISHELNQPLMAIRSFAENAVQFMERDKPQRVSENLSHISDMARRMGRIIQNLRAFARQESAPQAQVDVHAALGAAVDLTRSYVTDAGVTLDHTQGQAPVWVRGGEVRLSQVFVNLITNAVDAMAQSDTRLLKIRVEIGERVVVSFRDTGPGIEVPDKVFDPFYTTKSVDSTGGMGLGLSISYGIVQSFGGDIKGENCPDAGALFTVSLEPVAQEGEGS